MSLFRLARACINHPAGCRTRTAKNSVCRLLLPIELILTTLLSCCLFARNSSTPFTGRTQFLNRI